MKEKQEKWIKFCEQNPPDEVVLAACDTYDCGWTIDTVWWYRDKKCWMMAGCGRMTKSHLKYTHWRKLPQPPKTKGA